MVNIINRQAIMWRRGKKMSAVKPAVLIVHNHVFHSVLLLINPQRSSSRWEKYGHRVLNHAAVEEINQPCLRRAAGFITQHTCDLWMFINPKNS